MSFRMYLRFFDSVKLLSNYVNELASEESVKTVDIVQV